METELEKMRCSYCGSNFHTEKFCPHTWAGSSNRENLYCLYCGSNKHEIKACPKTWSGNANLLWNSDKIENHSIGD